MHCTHIILITYAYILLSSSDNIQLVTSNHIYRNPSIIIHLRIYLRFLVNF